MEKKDATGRVPGLCLGCPRLGAQQGHGPASSRILTLTSSPPLCPLDQCSLNNGGCSHNCSVAPGEGIVCSCPLGMELGPDNHTCQIQSYCAKHLKCSQKCDQNKFSVKCSCYEGWVLEPDGESCRSLGKARVGGSRAGSLLGRPRQALRLLWLGLCGQMPKAEVSIQAQRQGQQRPCLPLVDVRNVQTCREFL